MKDAALIDAINCCKNFFNDVDLRWKYEQAEIAERKRISVKAYVKDEARRDTRLENAVALMKNGISLDRISGALKISMEELHKLAQNNKYPSASSLVR